MTPAHQPATDGPVEPLESWSLQVWLEYSQVYLEPSPWAGSPTGGPVDDNVEVLHRAFTTGIAQGEYLTVFVTPHRDNSPMQLAVELWAARPPDDLPEWQEAFEASVAAGTEGMVWSSPTMEGVFIPVPAGTYRAVIAGRDFLRTTWEGVVHPDRYRMLLWRCDDIIAPLRLGAWEHSTECQCV